MDIFILFCFCFYNDINFVLAILPTLSQLHPSIAPLNKWATNEIILEVSVGTFI